jgi:2-isopropylmalate synthase
MAYLLEQEYGLELPRRLQIEFSRVVQRHADATGTEVAASDIHALFAREYFEQENPSYRYVSHRMAEDSEGEHRVQMNIAVEHERVTKHHDGQGNGPIDAFVNAIGLDIRLMDYHEHAIGSGADAKAACYVELRLGNGPTLFGAAIDSNILTASFKAVLSAVNRHLAMAAHQDQQPVARAA